MQHLLWLFFIGFCWATPVLEEDPELISGYTEGDMMIKGRMRNSVKYPWQKWPACTIRYFIHCKEFDSNQLLSIKSNFREITEITGLQFEEVTVAVQPLINITCEPSGCFASVGFSREGTRINLQNHPVGIGCFRYGTVGHEMSHVLGIFHEHMRPDRDDFVKINWQNIEPNLKWNFIKKLASDVELHGLPYDYGSNMHYGPYAFSLNGRPTIVAPRNVQIGQRRGFSELDRAKLKMMYSGCLKKRGKRFK